MDFTINVIWVIIGAFTLILSMIALVGALIKTNKETSRESERFESWLKTHEKEIMSLQIENRAIKESQALQNSAFIEEIRKVERLMAEVSKSNGIIQNTLNMLIKGAFVKQQDHDSNH